ncbi:MAG: AzlC family ABC transporter permease [Lachnospiraceae bacterium]|nr:AzlC family ABC transporter permease [Lachnospiraceae bacterium]
MSKKIIKEAFVKSLPVCAGYVVLGIGFGILLEKTGYGLSWAILMSVVIYAGSCQYVGVSLIAGKASLAVTAMTTLMVNARHLFYSISMFDKYKDAGKKKWYLIFGLTDETYSLLCEGACPEGADVHTYQFLVTLFDQIYWIAGSAVGAVLGSVITFSTAGIEFSMTALFVTVFVEQWLTTKNHLPAILGLASTAVCRLIFGREIFLIPSMITILTALTFMRKQTGEVEVHE